jgi:hypothetical protein
MNARWTPAQANAWYKRTGYLAGCNYAPRTAINQLEMWQAETFDPQTIDQELGWAASLGFNSMRVFLHDLLWKQDKRGFLKRVEQYLDISDAHGIGAMFVFFDSCWHPFPMLGRQPEPEPGVHNSGWAQSPGVRVLRDANQFDQLKDYVVGVVKHFRDDPRVHVWDVWNEPDNNNAASRGTRDIANKIDVVAPLLQKAFDWVRSARPSQPVTSGIWWGDWKSDFTMHAFHGIQIENSDVISFHNYGGPDDVATRIAQLQRFGRPLLCTEYMARGNNSTFQQSLPVLKKHNVAAYNWGFVDGRTQTKLPWDSWQNPYTDREPHVWFHEILHPDGTPYRKEETAFIKKTLKR